MILSAEGEIEQKRRFDGIRGAGDLAVDPERQLVYFFITDTAELVRVSVGADTAG